MLSQIRRGKREEGEFQTPLYICVLHAPTWELRNPIEIIKFFFSLGRTLKRLCYLKVSYVWADPSTYPAASIAHTGYPFAP